MKKFLILIALISTILCTIEDCNSCTNQNLCNDIKVEFEDFYCFKYSHEGASASQGCISFPINKNQNQKSFLNIYNGLIKEINFQKSKGELIIISEQKKIHTKKLKPW